jgi:succinoglycan biosynthesis transport protein ExoP
MDEPQRMRASGGTGPALEALLGALRRRFLLIVLCIGMAAAIAFLLSASQEPQYTATALALVRDPALDQKLFGSTFFSTETPERQAATTLRLASVAEIAERVGRRPDIGLSSGVVSAAVRVSADDSDVIAISATTAQPARSAAVANAYAEEFKAFQREADRSLILQAAELLRPRIAEADREGARELRRRLRQLETLAAVQTGGVEVVQTASAPTSPSSPRVMRNTVLGGIFGLFIGLVLAAALEQLDRRLRTEADVVAALGYPHLASIPLVSPSRLGDWRGQSVDPRALEAYKVLRETLRYFKPEPRPAVVLVASALSGEGKTSVARGLAAAAASAGESVLLLEADFRRSDLLAGVDDRPSKGLSAALTRGFVKEISALDELIPRHWDGSAARQLLGPDGDPLIDEIVIKMPLPKGFDDGTRTLDVLPSGDTPPNPVELLQSTAMRTLLGDIRARYELTVIDTAPLAQVADALPLMPVVDATIVVGRPGVTTRSSAHALAERLDMVVAPAAGTVVNGVSSAVEYRRVVLRPPSNAPDERPSSPAGHER